MARTIKCFSNSTLLLKRNIRYYATSIHQDLATEWDAARSYEEIPGPKPLPIVGNLHRFVPVIGMVDMTQFIKTSVFLQKQYGNIVKLGGIPTRKDMVFVYDVADIEKVFRHEGLWPQRPQLNSIVYYRKVVQKDFFKDTGGVLVEEGEAWYQARSKANPVLMQPRSVKRYAVSISDVAEDFVNRINSLKDQNNKMPDTFKNELHKWALESIALVALDTRLGCLSANLAPDSEPQIMINSVHDTLECMHKLDLGFSLYKILPSPTLNRFIRALDTLKDISMKYIQLAIDRGINTGEEDGSVLSQFLSKDLNPKRSVVMVLDMIAAGIDTTSHAVTSVLLHLCNNQDKQEKLFNELKSLLPDPHAPLTDELLNQMRYLRACIKEALRLQPPTLGNGRTMQTDIVLSNYRIPKGTDILMPNAYLSLKEEYFPRANEYLPERWLRDNPENPFQGLKINPFVSLPFGHGARKCVGMRFASLEAEVLIAKAIRRFRWEWHNPPMRYRTYVLTVPIDPLLFTVIPRE